MRLVLEALVYSGILNYFISGVRDYRGICVRENGERSIEVVNLAISEK